MQKPHGPEQIVRTPSAAQRPGAEDSRTFAYNAALQLLSESTGGASPMYSKVIERLYQSGSGGTVKGRSNGLRVSSGSPPYDYSTIYWYDGRGRLNRLSGSGTPWNYVNYLYLADSDLVEKIEYRGPPQEGGYAFVARVVRTFEPHRDLIASVENKWDSTSVSKFEYTNDALGRRTSVTVSGTAFTAAGTTGFDLFAYNDRNELTSARRYAGGTISNPSDPVYARHFEYAYDPIGNRETYEVSQGTATTYTTNELNQYTATANPSESFTYDDDGNLTQDGTYTYVWDAENRLIEAYPTNPTTGSQKCVMVYDYMNRRVKRTLYDWTGSAWSGTPAESRVFLYDGWNVLLSYNPAA
ncbi:MAG: hypothetical protein HUU22_19295, partial [Phycisphaerae bacterium]|nr:hypothetical protein [Phycisphaerae bacterium]